MAGEIIQKAIQLQNNGRVLDAIALLREGHQKNPDDPHILLSLGEMFNLQGEYANAVTALTQANQLVPNNPDIMVPLSKALSQTEKTDDAMAMAEAALTLRPDSIKALETASEVLFKADRLLGVIKCLERLHTLKPEEKRYLFDLSRFYQKGLQFEKAYETYQKLWDDKLATAIDYAKIGELAFLSHKSDEAIPYLQKAVEMEPKNSHSWLYLGRSYAVQGDKKIAKEAMKRSIAENPHFINAYFFLSEIEPFDKNDPAFATLEGFKTHENLQVADRGALGFALGRMYHGVKDYDKAFENYKIGNDCTKINYTELGWGPKPDSMQKTNKLVTALYSPDNRKKLKFKGNKSKKPVFIIGLPRSGTTLLEQILSAHSEFSGAGELRDMTLYHRDLMTNTKDLMGPAREAALLEMIDREGPGYAEQYLKTLEKEGGDTAMVVDKMPQNYLQLGLINVLFPNAKILHITRDPMDVGLSIYCNQFSIDWRFFQDLEDIAFYIKNYYALMAEWPGIVDMEIHEVDYQALVNDPEKMVRGIIDFCGQEWQPACLDFYKKESTVYTASALQIRNPVNRSGLGKWKAYEKHLGPLKQALET